MIALLHVSDVHFGPKHLPELSAAVLELARSARPAALVVSGDLTQRAKPEQFRQAKAWLAASPVPVVYVPGNHDVPMYRVWERLLAPFGAWRRHLTSELVQEQRGSEVAIVGLNTAFAWTAKNGRVVPRELEALERRLASVPAGAVRVLVAHHPLAPAAQLGGEPVARGGARALELCRRAGVELVLSGHLHHGFAFAATSADGSPGPCVAQCGTTTSTRGRGVERGRNSLHWIEIDAHSLRVERRYWHPEAGSFVSEAANSFPRRSEVTAAQDAAAPRVARVVQEVSSGV